MKKKLKFVLKVVLLVTLPVWIVPAFLVIVGAATWEVIGEMVDD